MDFQSFYFLFYLASLSLLNLVGIPLPVSVPPLPEEPALARMAPKDSLAFVAWSGAAEAAAGSGNRTERLCAEPEVRAMVERLHAAMAGMIAQEARGAGGLPVQFYNVGVAALQRPGCAFVRNLQFQPRPRLDAGFALKLGESISGAKALMGAVELLMVGKVGGGARHEDIAADGVTFHALPVDTEHPFLGWAEVDGWFLLAIGTETPAQLVAGLRNKDRGLEGNAAWQQLAPACSVARPSTRAFVDLARCYEIMAQSGGAQALPLFAALGLREATAAAACAGLEGDGFTSRLRIATPRGQGLLGVFDGTPLLQDDLARIPLDADLALSARVDAPTFEKAFVEAAAALFGDQARAEWERDVVAGFEAEFGLSWRNDVLAHLGGQLTAWNAPSQGGALFTGACGTLSLRDGKAFASPFQKLMDRLRAQMPSKAAAGEAGRLQRREYLETFEHAGRKVWWVDSFDDDFPFAFTWLTTDTHVLCGLMPQAVRATLDAGDPPNPDRSLVKLPFLNKRGRATAMFYWNAQSVLAQGYAPLLVLLQAGGNEWQREGFDFDVADVPRPGALLPHLDRELLLLEPVDGGWALTRNGTLPLCDPLTVLLGVGFAVLCDEL